MSRVGVESGDRRTCATRLPELGGLDRVGDDLWRAVRFAYAAEVVSAGRFGGPMPFQGRSSSSFKTAGLIRHDAISSTSNLPRPF
jgi:hypothetical protein